MKDHSWYDGDSQIPRETPTPRSAPGELTQLAQKAMEARQSSPGSEREGSGIIDLRMLMAAARKPANDAAASSTTADGTPIPVVDHVPIYPLGVPADNRSVPPCEQESAPAPRRFHATTASFVALGAAALAAATGLLVARSRPAAAPPAPTASTVSTATAREAEPTARPEPTTSSSAEVVPSGSVTAEPPGPKASAAPKTTAPGRRGPKARAPAATAQPADAPAEPPAAPAPPADPCNGDLMCAMKRATQGH